MAHSIRYLSPPASVSMADRWYEIASVEHFWILRRFDVLQRLAGSLVSRAREIAEVGCGHGLVQLQIERAYGRGVTGFDLNELALKENVSRLGTICCYDIHQRDAALRQRYDLIILFDVLEHITDENAFLSALIFHLAPGGRLIVNVPAGMWAFSKYDEAAGHVRRYSIRTLQEAVRRSGLHVTDWTYWGFPLIPSLLLRKLWLLGHHEPDKIISSGFDPRSRTINALMRLISRCEPIPQKFLGTSLMAVLELGRGEN